MQMTEAFASTAAVTIPVLALAGVVEMRSARDQRERAKTEETDRFFGILKWRLIAFGWLGLLVLGCVAEFLCLESLGKSESLGTRSNVADFTTFVIMCQMAFLVVVPAVQIFSEADGEAKKMVRGLRKQATSVNDSTGEPAA